jgi:nicotinic acid phosphoribosyltransferase
MIIKSLLDTDQYKLSMGNAVLELYPEAMAEYVFINRNTKDYKFNQKFLITGKVLTLEDIPDTKDNTIMRSNMKCNGIKAVIQNDNSWIFHGEFGEDDVLVDWNGDILAKGKDFK